MDNDTCMNLNLADNEIAYGDDSESKLAFTQWWRCKKDWWMRSGSGWSFGPRCWECARYIAQVDVKLGGFGFALNYDETDFKMITKIKVDKEEVWKGEIDTSQCERLTFTNSFEDFRVYNINLVQLVGLKPINLAAG